MHNQQENPATESLRMTIMNDRNLLERIENSVFPTNHITPASMHLFKHYIEKYVPLDEWAIGTQPDYLDLAQDAVRYIHGTLDVDQYVASSTEWQGIVPALTSKTTETSLMNGYNVEKLSYVDGTCIEHMSDDEIVVRIAAIEKDMETLSKIQTSSKAIQRQIKKMGKTTKLLASFLDDRYEDEDDD